MLIDFLFPEPCSFSRAPSAVHAAIQTDLRTGAAFSARAKPAENALAQALRQKPLTVLVGEIRHDMDAVIAASMSGHHVLATIHARSPREALGRLLSRARRGAGR
jgi:type IV secretory pathway ATPase VirB11/archaellum biosynthesis ATPase